MPKMSSNDKKIGYKEIEPSYIETDMQWKRMVFIIPHQIRLISMYRVIPNKHTSR